ncbi:ferredoxin:glutaredoxin reductase [Candidatus Bathyarchaeota archaeon]|nr:ferredoxin:glutaredoxin reductase [Candidatus Bathyarchaeota archaeon]
MTTLDKAKKRAEQDAKSHGIHLTPDPKLLNDLMEGLKTNEERYGYPSCPCRMASGDFETDRDITCPCDYRDPDVAEYGCCYCSLYVDDAIFSGVKESRAIPERRPYEKQMKALGLDAEPVEVEATAEMEETDRKLIYCKQCGYVVFREEAPYVCPICKAKQEMFEEIVAVPSYRTRKPV